MGIKPFGNGKNLSQNGQGTAHIKRRVLGNVILVLAVSVILAGTSPEPIRAAAVAGFLLFVSLGTSITAAFRRESAFVPAITRWDLAVFFYICSVIVNGFVDEQAVRALLEQMQEAQSGLSAQ